jgi:hypothetical protein
MFNHARTLLLNISGSNSPDVSYLGEELVPADYEAVTFPSFIENVRRPIFGADPDRAMLNYRIRQLLISIDDTDLQQYIIDLDNRITYTLGEDTTFAKHETWAPVITRYGGTEDDIATVGGNSERPDFTGRMFYQFNVSIPSSVLIQIYRETPPLKSQNLDLALTSGLSAPYDLFYTGHTVYVNTTNTDAAWSISGYLRPQISLAEIAAQLDSVGDDVLTELFGTKRIEPWNTFRNLWYDHPELPYKMGGLILALIYRTDAVRMNVNG